MSRASGQPQGTPVIVAGSANLDHIYHLDAQAPQDDLSYVAQRAAELPGGHGSNCAVAARRFGAATSLLSAIGDDQEGRTLLAGLTAEHIDTGMVQVLPGARTGRVFIPVFSGGYKFMVFDAEIRRRIGEAGLPAGGPRYRGAVLVVMDVEHPLRLQLLQWAREQEAIAVLALCASSPFDVRALPQPLLPDYLIGNEAEMRLHLPPKQALPRTCCITTLGSRGCRVATPEGERLHPGWPAASVDAVGAGDCFVGIFAAGLARGLALFEALACANAGAALSTQRLGAQTGYPAAEEVAALRHSAHA
jgi:ribokinase